jgi:hypothetical protein
MHPVLERLEDRLVLSSDRPAAITYLGSDGFLQEQVWAVGTNGHLYAHYFNQTGWHTDDHGDAGGGVLFDSGGDPAATTYWDGSFNQVQVWAVGTNGHLYAHYFNQTGWHTDDHGDAGGGVSFYRDLAVTTYWDGSFNQVQVWATGSNGHLYAHYLNQTGWHTDDHGNGGAASFYNAPAVTTYWDGSFNQIQVWVTGNNGHLYAHYFNQTGWHTDDHGNGGTASFYSDPAVTTYWDGSFNQVQVWARGDDGHLYAHYFNQTGWHTDDHGDAGGGVLFGGDPAVLTYWDGSFNQVQVWATGSNGHLYAHYFNQTGWHTDDHGGSGGAASFNGDPAVTTYWDGSFNQIHVWVIGSDDHFYAHYLNQDGWYTDDHGPIQGGGGSGGSGSGQNSAPSRPEQEEGMILSVPTRQDAVDLVFAARTSTKRFAESSSWSNDVELDLLV